MMNNAPSNTDDSHIVGWVLYDDSCGFCRRWIPFWKDTLLRRRLAIAPLQSTQATQLLTLPPVELLADLRLVFIDGHQIVGADIYRYLTKEIWWAYPVYLFSITPVSAALFDWGYRTFARNRFRFSRACGLQNQSHV